MIDVTFQLKGSAISVVLLELLEYKPELLKQALQEKIDQSPQFFINSPVLIGLEKLNNPQALSECRTLLKLCRDLGLQPIGFTAVPKLLLTSVRATGLAILPSPSERKLKIPQQAKEVETVVEERVVQRVSKVVTRPVRSGQQVYAEGADLIILSQVSKGAEIVADGHIHIYGSLRGRALAGVRGDTNARIFCQSLEAELVSINGDFMLRDLFAEEVLKQPAQVYLSDEGITIDKITA